VWCLGSAVVAWLSSGGIWIWGELKEGVDGFLMLNLERFFWERQMRDRLGRDRMKCGEHGDVGWAWRMKAEKRFEEARRNLGLYLGRGLSYLHHDCHRRCVKTVLQIVRQNPEEQPIDFEMIRLSILLRMLTP
jgi:hypothetical protein